MAGLAGVLVFAAAFLVSPGRYQKDFIQEYLLASAILHGVDPYAPISSLAAEFLGPLPVPVFPHPTPHPPPVGVLCLPLGLLSYQQANVVWFVAEVCLLAFSARALLMWLGRPSRWVRILAIMAMFAWAPAWDELAMGQLMTLLLVLLIYGWFMLRSAKDIRGGVMLGLVFALKLMAWPILLYLAIRGRWRAVWSAAATVAIANLCAVFTLGFKMVLTYYSTIGPSIMALYRAAEGNISLWSVGWRLFDGTGSSVLHDAVAPPVAHSPQLAQTLSYILPIGLLATGLVLALGAKDFDAAFGALICVSVLVSPIAWSHYIILTTIPLSVVAKRVVIRRYPLKDAIVFFGLIALTAVPSFGLHAIMLWVAGVQPSPGQAPTVPFLAGLITLVPTVTTLGLFWQTVRVDRLRPDGSNELGKMDPAS